MRATFAVITLLFAASSVAAATYKCQDAHGNWSEDACVGNAAPPEKPIAIDWADWTPRIGMTVEQFNDARDLYRSEASKYSFPDRLSGKGPAYNSWLGTSPEINRTTTARGTREQWVFRYGYSAKYLYFDDGVLVTIQD